ncbi:MAG: hypothetical protein JWO03_3840, partial [Bacteroidetes bacterium]|nr:hypothetical protein [Bacteroidota bacterium]
HMTGATGGCPSADTAHIHIQPSTQPVITQQAPQRCSGDPITLIATGGSGYTWSTTATTSSISIVPVTGTIYYVTATAPNLCPAVASFTVQGKSRMVVTSTAFNPPCPGRDMGTISISVSGATTPYHYLWSNGDTLSQTDSLSSGPYAVTVTDAGGCDTVLNFALTYGTFLSINTPDTTICPGKQVRLTASGGTGQYQWVNGPAAATNTVTATRDTMFIVHMTGATGGCPSADTAHIHIQPSTQPVITQQAPQRCAGDPITLIATGGAGYTWSTTATTSSISIVPVTGTIYYVTATAPNLCPAVASFTVQSKSPMVVTSTVSGPPCPGRDMGIISISVSGGSIPYHYLWSNSDTLSQTDSLSPGPYTVTVTDAGGCDSVLNFTLTYGTFLSINTSDTTICPGKQVRLTASGGTGQYQWVNGPAAATNTVTATTDSMFIVHMTGATGGCPAADTAHIHIQPSTQPVITQQAPQRCAGDPITLIASGGTGYTWSTIATTSSISIVPVTGAIYYVTATAPNLCPAVDTFIAQAKLPMIITPGQSDPPCPGRDVGTIDLFSGGNSYHYIWSNNDTTAHLNGLAPGVYTVTVSDGTGCDTVLHFDLSYSYTLQVAISPQDTTVPSGVYVPLQASTNVDNGNIYTWTPPRDLSCYDCPGPLVHAVDSTYTYTILVTDQYGCTALDSMHITTFPLGPIYIPNAFTPNGDNNNDFFQIFGPSVSREYIPEFEVKIFDRWGELIFVSSDPTFRWDGIYKGVLMPPGVYVYLIDYLQAGTAVTKHAKGSLALIR